MHSKRIAMFVFGVVLLFAAGCSSEGQSCNVADACISECATRCGEEGFISIACVGNACNCNCRTGGGGSGGAGGGGGGGGAGGGSGGAGGS